MRVLVRAARRVSVAGVERRLNASGCRTHAHKKGLGCAATCVQPRVRVADRKGSCRREATR
eukprot:2136200-Pleurochrysis_carterae.AAC.1